MIIYCFRKNGHVLIPHWDETSSEDQRIFEARMLLAIGWEESTLSRDEIESLKIAVSR